MNLTIPTGATVNHEVCFQVTIIGDDQRVENESFSIMLAPITPDIIVGESVLNVIIIDDNDSKPLPITLYTPPLPSSSPGPQGPTCTHLLTGGNFHVKVGEGGVFM